MLEIKISNPNDSSASSITEELSQNLYERFGSDGKNSFTDWDCNNPKYVFVIAELNTEIVGCGAIRPLSEKRGEVKRMFAKYPRKNIGQSILSFLETKAKELEYEELVLETRVKNEEACSFYLKANYIKIPNYGKYIGRLDAVCFQKSL
ncbi:GNAT family N-acetyltransferase [Flavobacterium aquariorum]|uniref:GNAT family N-acetyltransferase n=1 Tax=Flavobacterium aquariorum TaxID=2217670 RepID=A0A2W7UHZ0_9FLAO|nr:GNAT family N-acetyltransferase [Flavobacterium aquariorum]PZX92965.1 GNAT family N-acetyltransferase [Flavobacterium aquariorum]